jgi:valyl-tRNA synthetase
MNEVLKKSLGEIDSNFRRFRISEALMQSYKLFWDEFSGWYLEIIKPEYKKPVDRETYNATISVFDTLLRIIHPFMPFITEEIWQLIDERKDGESLMISSMPRAKKYDKEIIARFENVKETVTAIRTVRKEKQILNRDPVELYVKTDSKVYDSYFLPVIKKLCNISEVRFVAEKPDNAATFMVRTTEFHIPLGDKIDPESERIKIRTDLIYYKGFLDSVMKKLNNERFVKNAPAAVIGLENKKKADTESKIKSLEEALKSISGN